MFTSELATGRPIVLLDNAREHRIIDSPSLASVLTAREWTDRLLGHSRMVTVPNQVLWLLTGNCVCLSREIGRRAVHIRLDPETDQPWLRDGFRHPGLLAWVREHRAELVHALLILVQGWVAAGRPESDVRLGSFERWSEVIGGILQYAGIEGFLGDLRGRQEAEAPDRAAWIAFISAWWEALGSAPQGVSDLNQFCQHAGMMHVVRGNGSEQSQLTRLGMALQKAHGCAFGNLELVMVQDRGHRGKTYCLREQIDPEAPQAPQAPPVPPMPQTIPEASTPRNNRPRPP